MRIHSGDNESADKIRYLYIMCSLSVFIFNAILDFHRFDLTD